MDTEVSTTKKNERTYRTGHEHRDQIPDRYGRNVHVTNVRITK